jgi:peptidoglycan/LPS O-acetylase OafA/YrhL
MVRAFFMGARCAQVPVVSVPSVSAGAGLHSPRSPGASSARAGASASLHVGALPAAWLDLLKALASQLIVWHHLALYGPLCDVANALAPALFESLAQHARLVVQVFLVAGGFLAAHVLWPSPGAQPRVSLRGLPVLAWRRYQRLAKPYLLALLAVLVAAWVARALVDHPTIPAPAEPWQLVAHMLLLQDVLGFESLSAGFWYVAVDLQLYLLLAGLAAAVGMTRLAPALRAGLAVAVVCSATALSLLWWNLDGALDVWAPYFFGAYGLGVLARWARASGAARGLAALGLLGLVGLALLVEWRSRIALAGATALLLCLAPEPAAWRNGLVGAGRAVVGGLARISYPVFLLHYPVLLVVGAIVGSLWPAEPGVHAAALVATWALSLAAGAGMQQLLSRSAPAR